MPEEEKPQTPRKIGAGRAAIGWCIFWTLLFLPAAVSVSGALLQHLDWAMDFGGNLMFVAIIIWPLCALFCGFFTAWQQPIMLSNPLPARIALGVVYSFVFACVNLFVAYFGCTAVFPNFIH